MSFGSMIRQIRLEHDLMQKDCAVQLNISPVVLSNYENDRREPPLQFIRDFCRLFHVSADFLLGLSDQQKPEQQQKPPAIIPAYQIPRDPLGDLTPEYRRQADEYIEFLRQRQAHDAADQKNRA